jgi:hypothetical protein
MTENDDGWSPSPELLAAYFDGECEGRDDLAPLRRRLEVWLADHPRGREELADYRRLRQLWLLTTPVEPAPAAWLAVQCRLETCHTGSPPAAQGVGRSWPWKAAALLAGAACFLWTVLVFRDGTPVTEDIEPFPVAAAHEVVILNVEGADTGTLVVGELPVQGPLELAGPGDVTLTSVQPAQRDNMVPEVYVSGPGRPIIWVRADDERE